MDAYFPSNGTEGDDFEAKWCAHCLADKPERGCQILDYSRWACHVPQWVYRHGMPWCTAFEEDADNPARCLFTKELPL